MIQRLFSYLCRLLLASDRYLAPNLFLLLVSAALVCVPPFSDGSLTLLLACVFPTALWLGT